MKVFDLTALTLTIEHMENYHQLCQMAPEPNEPLPDNHYSAVAESLSEAIAFCNSVGFDCASLKIQLSQYHVIGSGAPRMSASSMETELRNVLEALSFDIRKRVFLYVEPDLVACVNDENLFGEAVSAAFPSAARDICDVGNCLAADCNTAAVFHAMLVAERGLKWLGKRLIVKLSDNKKPLPITEAEWHKIIQAIQNKIVASRGAVKGARRRARLEQYSRAAYHCDYMREIWRNNLSHGHKSYNSLEARAAVSRVRDFMQFLAEMK